MNLPTLEPAAPLGESDLEMARRHAARNEERIARQRKLIADAETEGHGQMLSDARNLLKLLEESQLLVIRHLARAQAAAKTAEVSHVLHAPSATFFE